MAVLLLSRLSHADLTRVGQDLAGALLLIRDSPDQEERQLRILNNRLRAIGLKVILLGESKPFGGSLHPRA